MAKLITTDGVCKEVYPRKKTFSLAEFNRLIPCEWVERVSLPDGRGMWLDEEGKFKNLPVNQLATKLLILAGGIEGDEIMGNVLLTDPKEEAK